jgi:hypothetical protein
MPADAHVEYLDESREDIRNILTTYGVTLTVLADGRLACTSIPNGVSSNIARAVELLSHLIGELTKVTRDVIVKVSRIHTLFWHGL